MKILKTVISKDAPSMRDVLWLKPVDGGFTAYTLCGCAWVPFKVEEDKGDANDSNDILQSLIGSVKDKKSANTINGAKTYADAAVKNLKAYIDERLAAIEKELG